MIHFFLTLSTDSFDRRKIFADSEPFASFVRIVVSSETVELDFASFETPLFVGTTGLNLSVLVGETLVFVMVVVPSVLVLLDLEYVAEVVDVGIGEVLPAVVGIVLLKHRED